MVKKIVLILSTISIAFVANSLELNDIISKIMSYRALKGQITYEVNLPSAPDPVIYTVDIFSVVPGDKYSECAYLIDWKLPREDKVSRGWSAYDASGNHFRFRDTRLQEFHIEEDSVPFTSHGGGVARTAQFTDILPPYIAAKLIEIKNDSTYHSSFDSSHTTLTGIKTVEGYDALEYTYQFHPDTGLPLLADFVYNPAGISEQLVTARFTWEPLPDTVPSFNEDYLTDLYGEDFRLYRTSSFRVENMLGAQVPTFSYSPFSGNGPRTNHSKGEADLAFPLVLVFIDPGVAGTNETIEMLHNSILSSGTGAKLILAVGGDDSILKPAFASDIMKANNPRKLISLCGVTAYPTVLLVNTDGTISNVFTTLSSETAEIVTQALTLL